MDSSEDHIEKLIRSSKHERALTEIAHDFHERLYWVIRKLVLNHEDANDVLQNTYIRIFKGLKSFGFRSSVKTWCFRIAYNESMRLLQKQQKLEYTSGEGDLTDHLNKLTADPYFDLDTVSYAFHESLIKLPEKQQRIFQMKYFDELTFDEIAEITTWNKNSIKTAFYAAKEKIIIQVKATV